MRSNQLFREIDMWSFETGLELAKLLMTFAGAIGVVWYWNVKRHALEQYRYLDASYYNLLQAYFDHPGYGDDARTRNYRDSFKGDELLRYHYFAMRVHSTMESLFDLSGGRIPREWLPIFRHHTALHRAWLNDHRRLHETKYLDTVLKGAL
jgi:hypothetical protein